MMTVIKSLIISVLILFAPSLVMAQENKDPACQVLESMTAQHNSQSPATSGAAYVAGVDVAGNPIVPADVNEPPVIVRQVIKIPVTVDMAQRLQGLQIDGLELKADFGFLEVEEGGIVRLNGQDISQPVHALCGQAYKVEPPVQPEGHWKADADQDALEIPPVPTQDMRPAQTPDSGDTILEGGAYKE